MKLTIEVAWQRLMGHHMPEHQMYTSILPTKLKNIYKEIVSLLSYLLHVDLYHEFIAEGTENNCA